MKMYDLRENKNNTKEDVSNKSSNIQVADTTNNQDNEFKDYDRVANERTYGDKEVSQRVKRGMVFWYNIDSSINKYDEHSFDVDGRKYHDFVMYGKRPWLVVSNNVLNKMNQLVTVVPLSTGQSGKYTENHVELCIAGKDTAVMCEQLRSVNARELVDYYTTLDDSVMEQVDDAIKYQLSIKTEYKLEDNVNVKDIEVLIETIIKSKTDKLLKEESDKQVKEILVKLCDSLDKYYQESVFKSQTSMKKEESQEDKLVAVNEQKTESKTQPSATEKFFKRYPQLKNRTAVGASDRDDEIIHHKKNEKWDKESATSFLKDISSSPVEDVMKKWGISSRKACMNAKIYLKRKFPEIVVTA